MHESCVLHYCDPIPNYEVAGRAQKTDKSAPYRRSQKITGVSPLSLRLSTAWPHVMLRGSRGHTSNFPLG